jgi:hypothetical protein
MIEIMVAQGVLFAVAIAAMAAGWVIDWVKKS